MNTPFFCHSCRAINPVDPATDHFMIFGLPRRYDLDEKLLHRRFLNITRDIHPDRFATSSGETVNVTMRMAARINEAYNVLKDPVLRAEYLLQQAGGKRASEDKRVPGNLLAEVMELRERIEEALIDGDRRTLRTCAEQVDGMHDEIRRAVAVLAERIADNPQPEQLDELRTRLNAMKYVRGLKELLAKWAQS
jgi:molecular chaperone HscB